MGFSAGIYVYPKYKDVEYKDLHTISRLIEYDTNDWAKKQFKSAEEFAQYDNEDYVYQSVDKVDFYKRNIVEDEYGYKNIYKNYADWCSNGSGEIYDFISQLGESAGNQYDCTRILSKKDIADFMQLCLEKILKYAPKPAVIKRAYKYQRDEEGEISEDAEITLFSVDGFEVDFSDDEGNHSLRRIDTNPDWDCCVGFPKEYIDDWEFSGYITGLEACAKILSEVDFENSFVVYSGGW